MNYVPILKWKAAEKKATAELSPENKKCITPLIQLVMPNPTKKDEEMTEEEILMTLIKRFKKNIPRLLNEIHECWEKQQVFIDPSLLNEDSLRIETYRQIASYSSHKDICYVPVINFADNNELIDTAISLQKKHKTGIALRITYSDLDQEAFTENLSRFMISNSLKEEEVDLIVDIQYINPLNNQALKYFNLAQQIPNLTHWKSFIFSGGSFPEDLTGIKIDDEDNEIPRLDWKNWLKGIKQEGIIRRPMFSDYTIQHPVYKEGLHKFASSTSIKYTLFHSWLIMRGKKGKFDYYLANANVLMNSEYFFGENFSFGDEYIAEKGRHFILCEEDSSTKKKTGNARTWLIAGINHHLTCTIKQLANLNESANGREQ